MKKISIVYGFVVITLIITGLSIYGLELYKNVKIRNANNCYDTISKAIIKNCGEKWGEPGNECRNNFFYKTPCGNAIREVYFPDKKWGDLKVD